MQVKEVVRRIRMYNSNRYSVLVEEKYDRMAKDPFTFFRGTCHLFYEDWPVETDMDRAPSVWICGDLHLENFGTYKGDNGLAYFDMNDFDEAILAPATWEIARFLTSLWLAADQIGVDLDQSLELEVTFLNAYRSALADGKARWVERSIAVGMVRELLHNLQTRKTFLDSRTSWATGGTRQLLLIPGKALPLNSKEYQTLTQFMERFARNQAQPDRFRFVDGAHRIAGTGSLGIPRYIVLVAGKGSPDNYYLLDIKQSGPSALEPYVKVTQPEWESHAERITTLQRRIQAIAPALLQPVYFSNCSWVLRELQPSKDRLELAAWNGNLGRLRQVVKIMGHIVAWGHLRSSGRQGSASADELVSFASQHTWGERLLEYARSYSETVVKDWRQFRDSRMKPDRKDGAHRGKL